MKITGSPGSATGRRFTGKGFGTVRCIFSFLILRGEIYLQKRSPRKDQYPEHWDSSAAGHLIPGESPEIAAHRELE